MHTAWLTMFFLFVCLFLALKLNLPASKPQFMKGDVVRVCKGELLNLRGEVEDVDEKTALIKSASLKQPAKVPLEFLVKYFQLGDHVKVLSGKYAGETGLITSLDDQGDTATLLSDMTNESVRFFFA